MVQDSRSGKQLPFRFWFYDGFFLTDKAGQKLWLKITGYAGILWTSRQVVSKQRATRNAYATGGCGTHFDRARLLEDYGNSENATPMKWPISDGAITLKYGRREGLGANSMLADSLIFADADEPTITLNTLFKVDKDSKTRMHTYNFKERVQNKGRPQHYVHGMFRHDLHLGLSRKYFYALKQWCCQVTVVQEDWELLYYR